MVKTRRIKLIFIVYWFLLIYIVAALVWWFISLQQQNTKMSNVLLNELQHDQPFYDKKVAEIQNERSRKTSQYIGEGATFLALILVGAVFVYRATRRQLIVSQQQQNFMMAVTHELKTPIAVARLNLETMQKRRLEEQQQKKMLAITLQEVNRLNALCNNILLASQLDAGEYQSNKQEIDLSELTRRVINDFAQRNTGNVGAGRIDEGVVILGEDLLIELLISNLVENAIKYSPKGAPVVVDLIKNANQALLNVSDEGAGIPDEEKSRIFEKFYRIGNEATRTAKGTGLGLYLCRQIVKSHHASITVSNNIGKGSVFTITFNL